MFKLATSETAKHLAVEGLTKVVQSTDNNIDNLVATEVIDLLVTSKGNNFAKVGKELKWIQ